MRSGRRGPVLALFFLSGACGLLYEMIWIRTAGTAIGNTTYAIGTVVGVYMAGLALGARWGGRAADRRSGAALLRLYGLLEGGVALSACAVPVLFWASEPLFRVLWNALVEVGWLYAAIRVLLVAAILIVPTTLMGATLPVLSRYLADRGEAAAREAGTAYAVNTLGGVAGALAAGLWLIPTLGLRTAMLSAAGANVAVTILALLLARGREGARIPDLSAEPRPNRVALYVSAVSGLASLVYEVAWSRSLALSLGSSVQALTLILSAFILGLGLGSALAARLAARGKDPTVALGIVQAAVGAAAIFLLPFFGDLPLRVADLVAVPNQSFRSILVAEFGLVSLLVLVPATLLGAVFPFACRLATGSDRAVGRTVGAVYTWNTVGCIAGSLLASFALVPFFGLSRTIRLAATINLGLAAALLALSPGRRRFAAAAPVAAAVIGWVTPSWSSAVLASGSYIYGSTYVEGARGMNLNLEDFVEHFSPPVAEYWDEYGLASVHRQGPVLTLRINGKADASTDEMDMMTQLYLAHVPLLHHPAPKNVLVIGLGAGFTVGAAARHPVESIDCVEISRGVVRASEHFADVAGRPLLDPRVRLIVGDGRNLLQFSKRQYDVVISEPSNLWVSGMANLFTRECFEQVRARLAPGGVFCQWMYAARLDAEDFRLVLRTFFSVFPAGSVWEITPGGDYLFLGCERDTPLRWSDAEARTSPDPIRKDFADPALPRLVAFAGHLLTDADGARAVAGPGPLVTDDLRTLDSTAPRSLLRDTRRDVIGLLEPAWDRPVERDHFSGVPDELAPRLSARRRDRRLYGRAVAALGGDAPEESVRLLSRAELGLDVQTARFREIVFQALLGEAARAVASGDAPGAARKLELIPRSSAQWGRAQIYLARAYRLAARREAARERYRAVANDPATEMDASIGLAELAEVDGKAAEATSIWRELVARHQDLPDLRVRLAACLLQQGKLEEAREVCRAALRVDPKHAAALKILEALDRR